MSGNRLVRESEGVQAFNTEQSNSVITRYREEYLTEGYRDQVLDGRSFASGDPQTGKTIGSLYKASGLHVIAASGKQGKDWIPLVNGAMQIQKERMHIDGKTKGAPQIYVFSTCVNLIREIEGYSYPPFDPDKDNESQMKPLKINDHGCTVLGYLHQLPLRYCADAYAPAMSVSGNMYNRNTVSKRDDGEYRSIL